MILIVDDNEMNLKLLRIFLHKRGYAVETARDGMEARTRIHALHPEVVLMDVQLPGINGVDLTREIKADARFESTIIIAVTSYAMSGDREKMLAAGFDAYISKPLNLYALEREICSLLAARQASSAG